MLDPSRTSNISFVTPIDDSWGEAYKTKGPRVRPTTGTDLDFIGDYLMRLDTASGDSGSLQGASCVKTVRRCLKPVLLGVPALSSSPQT